MSDDLIWARPGDQHEPIVTAVAPAKEPIVSITRREDAVITCSRVRRVFRRGSEDVMALDGVDLELRRGELVALVGRSGSGKTTLLNVLCGWEPTDSGSVTWGHTSTPVANVPWGGIALIPQSPGLLEDLTATENVALPCKLRGDARALTDIAVVGVLEALGLGELAERFPSEMSLGEQQRTSVARALVLGPELLLADEPTAHQDARSMDRVLHAIRSVVDLGKACLVASHSAEVLEAADRVVEMRDGLLSERAS
jgi:putative ABC transport system ATP-binding protein